MIILLVLVPFVFVVLVLAWVAVRKRHRKRLARRHGARSTWELPGIPHHPIFGAVGRLDVQDIRGFVGKATQTFNHETMQLSFPLLDHYSLVTSDPKDVEYILSSKFDSFEKGAKFRYFFHELLGSGIFNSDGEPWRFHRKAASHLFSAKKLRSFADSAFRKDALELCAALKQHATSGALIDFQDHASALTFQSFVSIAFGVSDDVITQTAKGGKRPEFLCAFDSAVKNIGMRFLTPSWRLNRIFNTGTERLLTDALKVVKPYIANIVEERRGEDIENRGDLLSQYMLFGRKVGNDEVLSDTYLADMITNFILAGRDTTASLLTSAVRVMDLYPDERDLLERECDQLLPSGERQQIDYELVKRANRLDAFLMETLRLLPPVPTDFKVASKEEVLPGSKVHLLPGDRASYNIMGTCTNPRVWGPDSWTFDPSRWIGDTKRGPPNDCSSSELSFCFPVFNAGPRLCLGKTLALVEAKITLLTLMHHRIRFKVQTPIPLKEWPQVYHPTAVLTYRSFKGTVYLR